MCPNKNSLPSEFLITTEYWLCQGRFLLLVMINNGGSQLRIYTEGLPDELFFDKFKRGYVLVVSCIFWVKSELK